MTQSSAAAVPEPTSLEDRVCGFSLTWENADLPVRGALSGVPRGPLACLSNGHARGTVSADRCCPGGERTAACFRQTTRPPRTGSLRVRWRGHLREGARHRERQR